MAEQVTPLTGSPLSQESRQVVARNTSVSGQAIRGSNLLSATPPNDVEVKNLQSLLQNQPLLTEIRSGIFGIREDINKLNGGLISIATLLQQDAVSEERNLRAKQESERRLAEEQIRLGKENEIEKKINAAIVAPVERIAPKVQGLFGNVLQSLGYLFGGWLTNQVIEYIQEEGKGNTERLTEIKNNIIKNLTIAGGILLSVKFGFSLLRRSLFGITRGVVGLLGRAVAAPFNMVQNIFKPPGAKPPGAKPPGGLGGVASNAIRGAGNIVKGIAGPLAVGSLATGLDIAGGEDPGRAVAGATTGMIGSAAAFAAGSLLPIPGSGLITSAFAYGPSADFGKGIYDKFFGKPQAKPQAKPEAKPQAKPLPSSQAPETPQQNQAKPNEQLIPPPNIESTAEQKTDQLKSAPQSEMVSEPKLNIPDYSNAFNLSANNTFQMNQQEDTSSVLNSEMKPYQEIMSKDKELSFNPASMFQPANTDNFIQSYNNVASEEQASTPIQPNQIQGVPPQTPQVGELPEPKPNVIYASSGSSQQQTPQMNQGSPSGPLTDVPMIRSSNPDNFYTLYSYSCYNVVV
jgi:hypothetical protein